MSSNYSYSIADAIRRNAKLYPDQEGIIFGDINARFKWSEVHERTNRVANALIRLGLSKGDHVGVLSNNSHCYSEVLYGCAKAGLIHVTMNPRLSIKELAYIINNCDVKVMFVSDEYWDVFRTIRKDLNKIECVVGISFKGYVFEDALDYEKMLAGAENIDPEVEAGIDDVVVIVNTSGTTGLPKGGMITHWDFYVQGLEFNAEFGLKPDDVFVFPWPLHHISLTVWHAYVMRGMKCVTLNFEPRRYAELLTKEKCTVTWVVPTMLNMLLDLPEIDRYDLRNIRHITWSASPMPPSLAKKCVSKWGNIFSTMLGSTECAALALFLRPEDLRGEKRFGSVGRPSLAKKVKVIKENGDEVMPGSGEAGEMIVSGCFFKGYYNDPEKTAQAIKGNWLYTGDMMSIDEDGFFYVVDRKDFLIKTGGLKVYPLEIENVIHELPQINDVGVIGLEDEKWGEMVTAAVSLKPNAKITEQEIIEYCKTRLASFKVPKRVVFLEQLPRDSAGKLSKRTLKSSLLM